MALQATFWCAMCFFFLWVARKPPSDFIIGRVSDSAAVCPLCVRVIPSPSSE